LSAAPIDVPFCEELAGRAAAGDADARRRLVESLWPAWIAMVRANRSMGPLARSEEHVHNVVGTLVEKLGRPDGRALKRYREWRQAHDDRTFEDWIKIVTKNAIRDYVRQQLGRPELPDDAVTPTHLLNELAASPWLDSLGVRPPITAAQTARELLEFAAAHLPANQVGALRLWLRGSDDDEIAREQGISSAEARKLVRAGVAVLRRKFGAGGEHTSDAGKAPRTMSNPHRKP
jgi:DNA-directed RNA polymerase specialized sigma24 family protein